MNSECWAELSGARKRFGDTVALDGLDLQVRNGELLAVLGPNGAGKTTAISLLLGLEQPDAGSALLFGQSPSLITTRRLIGVMMQEAELAGELKVRELIDLVASYYPNPLTVKAAMELTHTSSLANRPYGKLSGGQKRQAQFAMAVCGRPKLLFLDEPTVGLDLQARETMWAALRQLVKQGASIVLTTHYLEEADALADRIAVLARGRMITCSTVNEMRSLVVRKHITCLTALSAQDVARWPGVESAVFERDRLHIVASDAEAVIKRLVVADADFKELEVRRGGLAEAFAELTKEKAS